LIGKAKALQMFVTAEKLHALDALRLGLVDALSDNPVEQAMQRLTRAKARSDGEVP
jgi:enoyl-CoA hydratase/carnithine racemase